MVSDIVKVLIMVGLAGLLDPFVLAEVPTDPDDMMFVLSSAMDSCLSRHNIPNEVVAKLFSHPSAHSTADSSIVTPTVKCYLACLMEELHMIKDKTVDWVRVQEILMLDITNAEHKHEIDELLTKECKNKDFFKAPKDKCEPGYNLVVCIQGIQKMNYDAKHG